MRITAMFVVAALALLAIASPALAGKKLVEIRPGRQGWQILGDTKIGCNDGKWHLRFRVLVKGPKGAGYTVVSHHNGFEDTLEFLEYLQKNLNKVKAFETLSTPTLEHYLSKGRLQTRKVTYFLLRGILL